MPQPTIPVIVCPECAALEPGAYLGEKTGDVVAYPREHFSDRAGFLFCFQCGLVWRRLVSLPDGVEPATRVPDSLFGAGSYPGFNYKEGEDSRLFYNLARTYARYVVSPHSRGRQDRAVERLYDAEALCTILDLPSEIRSAVLHHLRLISERADLREFRAPGVRVVRAEAVTAATVALVMERFGIERPGSEAAMLAAFRFRSGDPHISPQEYEQAFRVCADWFGRYLWRDGPEDAPRNE